MESDMPEDQKRMMIGAVQNVWAQDISASDAIDDQAKEDKKKEL